MCVCARGCKREAPWEIKLCIHWVGTFWQGKPPKLSHRHLFEPLQKAHPQAGGLLSMAAVSTVLVSLTQCPHEDLPQAQSVFWCNFCSWTHSDCPVSAHPVNRGQTQVTFPCSHFLCFMFSLYRQLPARSFVSEQWGCLQSYAGFGLACGPLLWEKGDGKTEMTSVSGSSRRGIRGHWAESTFWTTMSTLEKLTTGLRLLPHFEEGVIAWKCI